MGFRGRMSYDRVGQVGQGEGGLTPPPAQVLGRVEKPSGGAFLGA